MKVNMFIPKDTSVKGMRDLYKKAEDIAKKIESKAPEGFKGFHTSLSWLNMVTEEESPKQCLLNVAISFACAAVVIFISTLNVLYTILVFWSVSATVFFDLGILHLSGWKIGTNESIMISIAS
jgi:predicted RND superfamily exporter protein